MKETQIDDLAPHILTLLEQGAFISLENGFWLRGLVEDNYVSFGLEYGTSGLYILNLEGVKSALKDLQKEKETLDQELQTNDDNH